MGKRRLLVTGLIMVGILPIIFVGCEKQEVRTVRLEPTREAATYRLLFGMADETPLQWDGSLTVTGGKLVFVRGYFLDDEDKVAAEGSWRIKTRKQPQYRDYWWPQSQPASKAAEPQPEESGVKGILFRVADADGATVTVRTAQGSFSSALSSIPYGAAQKVMDGRATIERCFSSFQVTQSDQYDDNPSLAVDATGRVWVTWVSYANRENRVRARSYDGKQWSAIVDVSESAGDYHRTAAATDGEDRVWVVWSANVDGNWDLYARNVAAGKWSATCRLTDATGPDINPQLLTDASGSLWLAWQSASRGNFDICLRRFERGKWGPVMVAADSPANEWEPALATAPDGEVYVAWDTYQHGNYDVYLRSYKGNTSSEPLAVTNSDDAEMRPSIVCDSKGQVWVAYENCGPEWGKDWGALYRNSRGTMGLGAERNIEIRLVQGNRVSAVPLDRKALLPPKAETSVLMPCLSIDSQGHLWLFYKVLIQNAPQRGSRGTRQSLWQMNAAYLSGSEWVGPIYLTNCEGRMDGRVAVAVVRAKHSSGTTNASPILWCAWVDEGRSIADFRPLVSHIFAGGIQADACKGDASINPALGQVLPLGKGEAFTSECFAPTSRYHTKLGELSYGLYWGDLHRHTDISMDGGRDGTIFDMYRYALDAAPLDFVAVTDHAQDDYQGSDMEYTWWRTQQSADLLMVPNVMVPLFGFERSLRYPRGHRNQIYADRGIRSIRTYRDEKMQFLPNDEVLLWKELNREAERTGIHGISIPHTSATNMGTDWEFKPDPVEPVVELFQGCRNSYEYEGAPKSAQKGGVDSGYEPGFVWNALAKGFKYGFIASSDHGSTHVSYAGVYAEDFSRHSILRGLQRRRCYAATDYIVMEYRMGDSFMGESLSTRDLPALTAQILGTTKVKQVEIIKNNTFVYSDSPSSESVVVDFKDTSREKGPSYYYVRVIQDNDEIAWGSPIWVEVAD